MPRGGGRIGPYHTSTSIPETAAAHGIGEGDSMVIETRFGKTTHSAHLTDRVDPRVINAAHGWWFPEESAQTQFEWKRSNFNMHTSTDRLGKAFGTPNLRGIGCRIAGKDGPDLGMRDSIPEGMEKG